MFLAHKRIPYVPQSSAGLTRFLGKLALLGMKQAQCSLCRDSDSTMAGVCGSFATWWELGQRAEKTKGYLAYHNHLSSGHFHWSVSYIPSLVLLPNLNSLSVPSLPNRVLHLYFLIGIVVSPFYDVFKAVTLKSILFNSFLSHILSPTPMQIFIKLFWFYHQHIPSWLYLLSPVPSTLLQSGMGLLPRLFWEPLNLSLCSPAGFLPIDFFVTFKF